MLLVATIPPRPPRDDLPDTLVIVALADEEAEYLCRLLWLDATILVIQYLVEFDKELLIHCLLEVRHADSLSV